ncbi:MAG TPA: type II CRISPR-associated endonuclease Cas1 [Bacteroidales bacterium]|nr:MAG: subtype II CRISPR-associated endonuclease Cas1 [Bacteroidetes bacterium GWF2_33_38]HBF87552.1 type II CRISPR-associated endonuclease Cas1 [Bacteroidales bacterium]
MIKRTLYFGNDAYLHTKIEQLVIEFADKEKPPVTVPIEDIGIVILDANRLTISQHLISKLLHNNVALITCDEKHLPQGLMLNLVGNTLQSEKFQAQISASEPLKKNLWQQTIKSKIQNQANLLKELGFDTENMKYWEQSVKSGDTDNYEARAAAFYWKSVFVDYIQDFKRGRFEDAPNNLLNYGYAILRAIVARNLVASGLLPTLGIHHHNKYNAYCLADDIMEPYRPYVDGIVLQIIRNQLNTIELTTEIKKYLLEIPVIDVMIDGQKSPLMIAVQRTTASLSACFEGKSKKLLYPVYE